MSLYAIYFTYDISELKARSHQKPSRTRAPRTSFKRPDSRMNVDWRTTKDQDYNMDRGAGIQWVQPTEPRGHMIQYSQLRLLESNQEKVPTTQYLRFEIERRLLSCSNETSPDETGIRARFHEPAVHFEAMDSR